MVPAIAATTGALPADRPRYVMGLGDPAGMVEAVGLGVDLFDCVMPTRIARHGSVLTDSGRINLRNARWADGRRTARPGLRLRRVRPVVARPSSATSCSSASPPRCGSPRSHNLAWTFALVGRMRAAIEAGTFAAAPRGGAFRLGVSGRARLLAPPMGPLILLAVTFLLMWVLFILPQQRRLRAHQAVVRPPPGRRRGDDHQRACTARSPPLDDEDDVVHLEIAPGTVVRLARGAVAQRLGEDAAEPPPRPSGTAADRAVEAVDPPVEEG